MVMVYYILIYRIHVVKIGSSMMFNVQCSQAVPNNSSACESRISVSNGVLEDLIFALASAWLEKCCHGEALGFSVFVAADSNSKLTKNTKKNIKQ